MPQFSFDTVPVYMHTCNTSGPWNETTLQFFTKFPLITFEKGTGVYAEQEPYTSLYTEDKIIEACKQIKSIKPDIICIMYFNTINDWPYYRLHELFAERPQYWLRDDNNEIVLISGDGSFPQPPQGMLVPDYRQPEVQKFWADGCINITRDNYGIVDGCFNDKPSYNNFKGYNFTQQELNKFELGHNNSMTYAQSQLNASNASFIITDGGYTDNGIIATMQIGFNANEANIEKLVSLSNKGLLVEAHAGGCDKEFDSKLAAFLIGMNKYSYFACSKGWIWPGYWNVWFPEYDKPLGEPLGLAVKTNDVYTRKFKSGTNVTFDVSTNTGTINWAS